MNHPTDCEHDHADGEGHAWNRECPDRFILKCEPEKSHHSFSFTMFTISPNTSAIDFPDESITIASAAATSGESSRVVSRRSRSLMSESVSSYRASGLIARSSASRRSALSLTLASKK